MSEQKSQAPKCLFPLNIKNDFIFNPSSRDFIVTEIPLYEFSGDGEHLVLYVRKKELTTWEMIEAIAKFLDIKQAEIGYAGLKDKHAMTMQYISLPAKYAEKMMDFKHENIKILNSQKHNNKLRVGHLKGNHFKVRLKKVLGIQKDKLDSTLKWIKANGIPNYFGVQRFGNSGNNWQEGRDIIEGKLKIRNRKNSEFLIGAYQSYLFNGWLSKRVELSILLDKFSEQEVEQILNLETDTLKNVKKQKNFFKILEGDLMMHYPHGRVFLVEDELGESERFSTKDIAPTGLIAGERVSLATDKAKIFEEPFNLSTKQSGSRRYAWIWVEEIKREYIEEKAQYELSFFLPKGCYATNVIDVLRG